MEVGMKVLLIQFWPCQLSLTRIPRSNNLSSHLVTTSLFLQLIQYFQYWLSCADYQYHDTIKFLYWWFRFRCVIHVLRPHYEAEFHVLQHSSCGYTPLQHHWNEDELIKIKVLTETGSTLLCLSRYKVTVLQIKINEHKIFLKLGDGWHTVVWIEQATCITMHVVKRKS